MQADPLGQAEDSAMLDAVLSERRHDLRNKLGSLRNAAFFLRRQAEKHGFVAVDPRVATFFGLIDSEIKVADELLESPAEVLARSQFGKSTCDLEAALDLALGHLRVEGRVERRGLAKAPRPVALDREGLAVAVRAVVENALEAAGGQAVVEVDEGEAGARISVLDRGPGIPAADHDKARRAFYTTKPGHLGMGLTIASRILRRAGGNLSLAPADPGLRVVLELPVPRQDDQAFADGPGAGKGPA